MKYTVQRKIKRAFFAVLPFLVLFVLWTAAAHFKWVANWFLPPPWMVFESFQDMVGDGVVLKIVAESALQLIPPYLLAVVFSVVFGILIGVNRTARDIFFPFISTLYPIPSLAWLPFIIIIFGFTMEAVWVLLFSTTFLKMIYNMIIGVRSVNPIWILAAQNLGLSRMQIIFEVIIPGAFPNIITGMRIGFASVWRSVIEAGMLISGVGGLGRFMWMAQWTFDFGKVFVGIILIAIIGFSVEFLVFKKLEKMTLEKWGTVVA